MIGVGLSHFGRRIRFMRFGINTFLFTSSFTNESTRLFSRFKRWGFESVEIPIADLASIDPIYLKARLDERQLVCGSLTPCLGPDKDLRGTRRQQRAGVEFMKRVINLMAVLQCPSLIGVV